MTHLLTADDCESLRTEMLATAVRHAAAGDDLAAAVWTAAIDLLDRRRLDSFQRRARCAVPAGGARKTLGLRLTR